MNVGMLWFDNDRKSDLLTKVTRAATYYKSKYGKHPNICFVHPSMANSSLESRSDEKKLNAGDIEVCLTKSVLPNHFWIGIGSLNGNMAK
jgi:hypothetical protein